jgi:short-subunit dehydrogenase
MPRKLSEAVVVITGPTSGIGRASALRFAEAGATLVLGARREDALQEVAHECERRGARALAIPTDVSSEEQVQRLARQAVEAFGRIDVWVNNAAVTLFARVEDAPTDAVRKVLETNLFGYLYGARAVLPVFREQGSGVLINVDSVVGATPQPYTSAYVISKAGIRALADCLRMELSLDDAPDIHVCTVLPASIDTPFFQHAANYTGRAVKPLPPVYPADRVASAIVRLARRPRREVFVGSAGRMLAAQRALMPGTYERAASRSIDRHHLEDRPAAPTSGNLFAPSNDGMRVSGGWSESGQALSGRQLALIGLGVAALPLAAWMLARRNGWEGSLRSIGRSVLAHDGLRRLASQTSRHASTVRSAATRALDRAGSRNTLAARALERAGRLRALPSPAIANDGSVRALLARAFGREHSLRSLVTKPLARGWRNW